MDELPGHLGHRPVYAMPYASHDGIYAGNTDVQFISDGLAQYDSSKISVKAIRHTSTRWSRQSEELPAHRIVDMTLLMAQCLFASDAGVAVFPAGTFDGQGQVFEVKEDSRRDQVEIARFHKFVEEHGPHLKGHLNALADVLTRIRQSGQL